jgi:hypothetical protein
LKVSDFIHFNSPGNNPLGNCVDFSNLFQVTGAALGTSVSTRGIHGPFFTNSVKPIGRDWVTSFVFPYHQTGWANTSSLVSDPCFMFNEQSPVPAIDLTDQAYQNIILNPAFGSINIYVPDTPTRPILVI